VQDCNLQLQAFTGLVSLIYPTDRSFDLHSYYTKISLVVLPLDVLNLCALRGIVLLRKYAHKSYIYIPPPVRRRDRKQTYLLYYMLDILFTFCTIICELCNSNMWCQIPNLKATFAARPSSLPFLRVGGDFYRGSNRDRKNFCPSIFC
jgi:hypothetical protein